MFFGELIGHIIDITGKDQDVGEVLVKSLQKAKYSIDEKLEKSFISLFGQKHAKDNYGSVEQIREIEPSEGYHSGEEIEADESDDESDGGVRDGSESSDQDEAVQKERMIKSEDSGSEEDNDALDQQNSLKDRLQERVEYHGGRIRRKAFFGNDIDHDDLKVNDAGNYYALNNGFMKTLFFTAHRYLFMLPCTMMLVITVRHCA